jgi:hypothetical protein
VRAPRDLRPTATTATKDTAMAPARSRSAQSSSPASTTRSPGTRRRLGRRLVAVSVVTVLGAFSALASSTASAAPASAPWWHLISRMTPARIEPGGTATIVVQAMNLGNQPTAEPGEDGRFGTEDDVNIPYSFSDRLPEGLELEEVEFFAPNPIENNVRPNLGPTSETGEVLELCRTSGQTVTCSSEALPDEPEPINFLRPVVPYDFLEMRLKVRAKPTAETAEINQLSAAGGGAPPASAAHPVAIGSGAIPFGVEEFTLVPEEVGGGVDTRAGSHPYQLTTQLNFNQNADINTPPALPRNLQIKLSAGQLGNARVAPQCDAQDFAHLGKGGIANFCSPETAIGVVSVTVLTQTSVVKNYAVPIFNLVPARGEPARFGFEIIGAPVILQTSVRSGAGEDYGVDVDVSNVTQLVGFVAATTTFWGAPADPSHNESRGWTCLGEGGFYGVEEGQLCTRSTDPRPPAFLTMPTDCTAPYSSSLDSSSWPTQLAPDGFEGDPFTYALQDEAGNPLAIGACNQVPFEPQIDSEPTSNAATSPTGLNFDINVDDAGLQNQEGLAQSQLKKAVVTLPEGFTTNPSVAEGLKACPQGAYESTTVESGGCPEESKIGEVEIESPLVEPVIHGSLYIAKQGENPNPTPQNPRGNLLTVYLIARNPEIGVMVKQALRVTPNPVTGQLTTEVDNVPQLPFGHFHLSFRQGQRSPLITPAACGPYTVSADLYPWSNPAAAVHRESSFQITQGPEGQGCPSGGVPPFHPDLTAGSENPTAGAYSPFYTEITRKDSEQEITRFQVKLPTGMLAKLKGVSECSDAQIAAAKAREHEGGGAEEEASPSCPANSLIGHSDVGTGVGSVLAYAGGKLYLGGPYHGSPLSLVSITAAKVGPFDLGTVVVRFALDVNHETAEVSVDGANSDPIPHIIDGIPVHLRDIQAYVDRPGFALNPTSCAKKSTASTILGSGLDFASSSDDVPVTVSSPFQVGNCASLGFKPELALSLTGKKTHRGALPAFKAVLTYPKNGAYANIAKAQVTLPPSEFLEQGHLKNVCTRKVFETGANPGENCPKNSIYGKARAVTPLLDAPLEGPVYLRTGYGTKLPELAAALNGPQISITLAGKIDSVHVKGTEGSRIRNTFALVPDAPVEKFVLELKGGKKGLLVNSTDVCKGTHKALAAFTGQNGKLDEYEPALKAQCADAKKSKKSGKKK